MVNQILSDYHFPEDLKTMSLEDMDILATQIRDFLIEEVSKTGGHLASNLGVVEITIALHKYFNSPTDQIVWDVGHQSYVHKILTGRSELFDTLRTLDGLSGFPKAAESDHDVFDAGHSSNSLSVAAGLAAARDQQGKSNSVIAVIGDGALTGGMAYEALNNIGASKSNIIVILNDNGMSISKNTGSMPQHLSTLRTSKGYLEFKSTLKKALSNIPSLYQGAEHLKDTVKYAVSSGGAIFEELGFTYLGPVDGHNIEDLLNVLTLAKRVNGPVLIHAITKKGKGYRNAESNPGKFHGIAPFDIATGNLKTPSKGSSYSKVFGDKLISMAATDSRVVAVSAAMIEGTGLTKFSEKYPDRIYDVGIAEEHAVSFAAGLAKNGLVPFVAIYSTFLQRGYDQIMMDVCLNELPVIFAIDRAGVVGQDGQTHHGLFDLSYLSHMPGLTVLSPRDGIELEQMMDYAVSLKKPVAIRYPRGTANNFSTFHEFDGHNYFMVNHHDSEKSELEIWASGKMLSETYSALELLGDIKSKCSIFNVAIVSPLDTAMLDSANERTKRILTIEDNVLNGGLGMTVSSYVATHDIDVNIKSIAWPTQFIEHGSCEALMDRYEIDAKHIAERIREFVEGQIRRNFS